MTIIDYQIVSGATAVELQAKVKALVQSGWQTVGGVVIQGQTWPPKPQPIGQPEAFLQTVVKYVP